MPSLYLCFSYCLAMCDDTFHAIAINFTQVLPALLYLPYFAYSHIEKMFLEFNTVF